MNLSDVNGSEGRDIPRSAPRISRKRVVTTGSALVAVVAIGVLLLVPTGYVIEQPGPVYDTLGAVTVEDKEVPMIEISGTPSYDTTGSLNLLTVSTVGTPEYPASIFGVASAWFDRTKVVLPLEALFPPSVTAEERTEQNRVQMVDSQQTAIAAALTEMGTPFDTTLTVTAVTDESPAVGVFEKDDIVTSVDGQPVHDLVDLRGKIAAHGVDSPATVGILRDGTATEVKITPVIVTASDGTEVAVMGISVVVSYTFPIDVTVQLDRVGGPSAGMMFALGIIDKTTPDNLTGGFDIAGTGTISASGAVGAIGGVRQKAFAAAAAGATIFLLPTANCGELGEGIPDSMEIYPVETLADSLHVLDTVTSGGDVESLPRCEIG
ncbi:PDZ domain-containing protein [Klugiella xanthotipulae]